VDISGDTTADEVRDTIIAAVNGATIDITASDGGAATVTLNQDGGGSEGWTAITTTGTPPGTYTDFTGDSCDITFHDGPFTDGEAITFTSGTATLGTWDEGDVIVVLTSLKDEWVEGLDVREIQPGGSKEVPEGMYFRVKLYNAHASDALRVKVSLTVGRL
jgi:hypothetical protein